MARILITSGPTRQYLDPVRYLTNGSSGRMGRALTQAAVDAGHEVVVVSGPVSIEYPAGAAIRHVISTEQMLQAAQEEFVRSDGLIGVAAPCDYRPVRVERQKISKTGEPLILELEETPDVVACLGACKRSHQWVVGFALETQDRHFRALRKLEQKRCDLMVLNSPEAMDAVDTSVEIVDPTGSVIRTVTGPKSTVAEVILATIQQRLIHDLAG
jgi:phosphopantothenoylcysteine decarboxylase/phosphopantothenate--cysteine ligase